MPISISELSGDVHIPLCDRDRCTDRLVKLEGRLKEKNLKCVLKYAINTNYLTSFEGALDNCSCTIIHRCHNLWDKICELEPKFNSDDHEVIAIDISSKAKLRHAYPKESNFHKFFLKKTVIQAQNDGDLRHLVGDIVNLVGQLKSKSPDNQDTPPCEELNQSQEESAPLIPDKYAAYSDLFGHETNVLVSQGFLSSCRKRHIDKDLNWVTLAGWNKDFKEEPCLPHDKLELHKELPHLIKNHKIVELALIACCPDEDLQNEAIIILEMLLLNSRPGDKIFELKHQIVLETVLATALFGPADAMPATTTGSFDESRYQQRLSSLYMMVLSNIILMSRRAGEKHLCDIHFRTISGRDYASKEVSQLLSGLHKTKCSKTQKTVQKFTDDKKRKKLCKKSQIIQSCLIFKYLKQLFQTQDEKNLEPLRHCLEARCEKLTDKFIPSLCDILMMRGLTVFLKYKLKEKKGQDLSAVALETTQLIQHFLLKGKLSVDMFKFLQCLLFDQMPLVQKGVFVETEEPKNPKEKAKVKKATFFNVDKSDELPYGRTENPKEKAKVKKATFFSVDDSNELPYEKNQFPYLLNQMQRLLSPLLVLTDMKQSTDRNSIWEQVGGKFLGVEVKVHIQIPIVDSHREKNEAGYEVENDIRCHEMRVLQDLQHSNIIKMLAYQSGAVPQFYIVEDFVQTNLHTTLKHRKDNLDCFGQLSLLKFVQGTLNALEFCHSKQYVHCNLTTSSVFIGHTVTPKLCNFTLSLKLVDGRAKMNIKRAETPVQWTAPESLIKQEYTIASDVWMFGHLMYEVLTHGQQPYDNIEGIRDKIITGAVCLPEEGCFSRNFYKLILDCCHSNPSSRLSIPDLQKQLSDLITGVGGSEEKQKERIQESQQSHGNNMDNEAVPEAEVKEDTSRMNISTNSEDQIEKLHISISETLTRITKGNEYIFRERLYHVTSDVVIRMESGELRTVLDGVKIFQRDKEVYQLDCCIPISCLGNLLTVAFEKKLGMPLKPYLDCLLHVASYLKFLHSKSWILGDLSPSTLYVEETVQGLKVYVVSLAHLKPCEQQYVQVNPPKDTYVCQRAAPEVVHCGRFSPASDVYCFGYLIWQVLFCLDHKQENVEHCQAALKRLDSTPDKEYQKKVSQRWEDYHSRPDSCPDDLWDLIKLCVEPSSLRRITVNEIITHLSRLCSKLNTE